MVKSPGHIKPEHIKKAIAEINRTGQIPPRRESKKYYLLSNRKRIILIARSSGRKPDVVGLGVVAGSFKKSYKNFKPPKGDNWKGSLRTLSPFLQIDHVPKSILLMSVLRHIVALRKLRPNRSAAERTVCRWLGATIGVGGIPASRTSTSKPGGRITRLTDLPYHRDLEFQVRTSKQVKSALKRKEVLVQAFRDWLEGQTRELAGVIYDKCRCDGYEKKRNNLIEAKSSTKREYIRMAVGQLLDYAYLGKKQHGRPNLAILLPREARTACRAMAKK